MLEDVFSKTNFKTHIRVHTKKTLKKCSQCDCKFARLSDLKKHKRTVLEKLRSFVCEIYGSMFGRNPDYQRHMLIDANAKSYKCIICSCVLLLSTMQLVCVVASLLVIPKQ